MTAFAPAAPLGGAELAACAVLPGACVAAAVRRSTEAVGARASAVVDGARASASNAVHGLAGDLTGLVTAAADPIRDASSAAQTVSVAVVVGVVAMVALVIYLSLRYG